jgi:hypothetical protein
MRLEVGDMVETWQKTFKGRIIALYSETNGKPGVLVKRTTGSIFRRKYECQDFYPQELRKI